jgi:ABC-2 type transport system permease protein
MSTLTIPATNSTLRRDLGLVSRQVRYEQRTYWRNRGRGVFTFAFPLMFLVIFASLDKGGHITSDGGIPYDDFLVPGILAYGVIMTTFTNMSMSTTILRDAGVLKRMQGTPLPRWAYTAARIGSTCLVTATLAIVTIVGGILVWGVDLRVQTLPGLVLTLLLGTAAFTTIGIGMAQFIPKAETGAVIINLIVLPISFISNIWYPTAGMPAALRTIADIFPINALARGLQYAFDPRNHGAGFDWSHLLTLAIWTVIGIFLMLRFLRKPQGEQV